MINHGRVRSVIKPPAIRVDEFHVWVHSNIVPISKPVTDGDEGGGFTGFEFNMVQYRKDDWIQFISESLFDVVDTIDTTADVQTFEAANIAAGSLKLAIVDPKSNIGKVMGERIQNLEANFLGAE